MNVFKTLDDYNKAHDMCSSCITWNCEVCPNKAKADSLNITPGREKDDE